LEADLAQGNRVYGHFGDAVSVMFGAALPSPHLKKTNIRKVFAPILKKHRPR
jgi:hypothetical protein